jgi:hypothetical protein
MENAIILIGPKQWGEDHLDFISKNGFSSLQYSVKRTAISKLKIMNPAEFSLYIYVPKRYMCGEKKRSIKGSGRVQFVGKVTGISITYDRIPSPWRTVDGPKWYDMHQDFKYELWFKVTSLDRCDLDIGRIPIVRKDGSKKTYSRKEFTRTYRRSIPLAIKHQGNSK